MGYYYKLYYGSTLLRDSRDLDDYYEDEDEAYEFAINERDSRISMWELDGAWNTWDSIEEFDIVVEWEDDDSWFGREEE